MMREIYGRAGGSCGGKGGSMHIADFEKGMMGANGIVGGGPPLICGAALTAKTLKTGGVAVAFIGDGAANQGTTQESLNLAAVWNLPAIFVVEDNGWGEATASSWAVAGDIAKRAEGYGIPARSVAGVDFFAVHEAAGEAVRRARTGGGPTLLHLQVDRYYGHFEGDAQTYRAADDPERLRREKDPLTHFRARVTEAGLLDIAQLDEMDAAAKRLIDEAVEDARSASGSAARGTHHRRLLDVLRAKNAKNVGAHELRHGPQPVAAARAPMNTLVRCPTDKPSISIDAPEPAVHCQRKCRGFER